jgi:hypothetical protein
MPGPFPGMDPYLESRHIWESFHTDLISQMALTLNRQLPEGYVARSESRCYVTPPMRGIAPDVAVKRRPAPVNSGGTIVLEWDADAAAPTGIIRVASEERREHFIEIHSLSAEQEVVTIIEVLSPANKTTGNPGRDSYLRKQEEVLASETHLLEIDLLRGGTHTVAAPREQIVGFGEWDYVLCLHRADVPSEYSFWLNRLQNRLPRFRVPLREGEPDVIFDLQPVVDFCYDGWRYGQSIDYRQEPVPALNADDAAWADTLLREQGLRP